MALMGLLVQINVLQSLLSASVAIFHISRSCEDYSPVVGSLNGSVKRADPVSVIIRAGQHETWHTNDRNNDGQVLKVTPALAGFIAAHSFSLICH